ncbi:YcxB-like protein [Actinomadura pelletieri DSM 43383]|uniref:YcxB-like protein n=1 Tax=Actinomadura pelletieri DSM 43383 TaxID=1120940 RepID=A0A495QZ65_9ACTN|nr:YcxB family protein [Actinomadura pelletieri]RKS79515.1 YcxB-like protein [Actinomadura pelletieri DSM 43383]
MQLEVSYVPTPRDRRRAVVFPWFVWLLYAGLVGFAIAVVGIGALSRAAARHGEATNAPALAAVGGVVLLVLPLLISLWTLVQPMDQNERHISITPTRIRWESGGVTTEVPWARIGVVRESPHQWILGTRNQCLALPKRAVPQDRITELRDFLDDLPLR